MFAVQEQSLLSKTEFMDELIFLLFAICEGIRVNHLTTSCSYIVQTAYKHCKIASLESVSQV